MEISKQDTVLKFKDSIELYLCAMARVKLIAVVVVWTALIMLTLVLVSSPKCWAIRGTSFAASMTPRPRSAWDCMVIKPIMRSVVCIKVVKQRAMICLHHDVNPSVIPLGRLKR